MSDENPDQCPVCEGPMLNWSSVTDPKGVKLSVPRGELHALTVNATVPDRVLINGEEFVRAASLPL